MGGHIGHGFYNFLVFCGRHGIDFHLQVDVVSDINQIHKWQVEVFKEAAEILLF
jgi:hypothetical protein